MLTTQGQPGREKLHLIPDLVGGDGIDGEGGMISMAGAAMCHVSNPSCLQLRVGDGNKEISDSHRKIQHFLQSLELM